jgi:hypothetical protein
VTHLTAVGYSYHDYEVMQELLSKTTDPQAPLQQQEFYELRLDDLSAQTANIFSVREAHASWSEEDGQIMWDNLQNEEFGSFEQARARYEDRRAVLILRGFIHSDLDLF